jgi:G3E family GTPase
VVAVTITPVTVLTGFLGSGKTTLLNRILRWPQFADTAVLINEFGAVGLDHVLVRESSENIVVMPNGCICCTVAGDLVRHLRDLYSKRASGEVPAFKRVIIETTGLADPAPILKSLIEMPVTAARYSLAGVVTTVDVTHAMTTLDAHAESVKQVAVADRIVLTKTDVAAAEQTAQVIERIRALNPAADLVDAASEGGLHTLFDMGIYRLNEREPQVQDWLRPKRYEAVTVTRGLSVKRETPARSSNHDSSIQSFTLSHDKPLVWADIEDWLRLLLSHYGDHILRMKGIVHLTGEPAPAIPASTTYPEPGRAPIVLHAVQHTLYPPGRLPAWPKGFENRFTHFVFIVRNLPAHIIVESFSAMTAAQVKSSATTKAYSHG